MPATDRHLHLYRRERAWTRGLVAALPAETFDWRPAPQEFSCGEIVRHLILAERFWRRLFVEAVEGRAYDPFGYAGSGYERHQAFRGRNFASSQRGGELTSYAACLLHWETVQRETEETLSRLGADELESVVVHHPIANVRAPLGEMIHYMISHEIHHRGQLSAYVKVLGLPQPPVLVDA